MGFWRNSPYRDTLAFRTGEKPHLGPKPVNTRPKARQCGKEKPVQGSNLRSPLSLPSSPGHQIPQKIMGRIAIFGLWNGRNRTSEKETPRESKMEIEASRSDEPDIPPTGSDYAYFKFDKQRDSPDQARSALLVVASLVVAATYQAITSLPDVFKEKSHITKLMFVYANTLAWSFSATIIESLTDSFPLKVEVRVSLFTLGFAYGVIVTIQADASSTIETVLLFVCIVAPFLLRVVPSYIKSKC